MNKKRLLAILTAVLVLLIAMVVVLNSCQHGDSEPTPTTGTTEATTDATISSTEAATEPEETTAPTEVPTETPTEAPTEAPTDAPTEPEETEKPDSTDSATYRDVNETVYATTDVNVRAGAGTSYDKLGRISKDTAITRTGIGDNGWSRVEYNGKTAYISSKYLTTEMPGETEHKHDYKSKVTAPTCTEIGYTTYTCSCGDTYKDNETKATGHDYKKTVVAPTKTAQGYTLYECKNCDYEYKSDYTDKLPAEDETEPPHNHSYSKKVTAPTCESKGYTTYTCACGHSYKGDEKPALGHDWDNGKVTKKPTCTETGVKTYTCKRSGCGKTKEETIAKVSHEYKDTVVAPTCTAKGYTQHKCKVCGDTYKDSEKPALGHDWDDGKVTKKPTCTSTGIKTYTCERCGETKEETIAKTGHSYENTVVAPTCTAKGYTLHKCSVCGNSYKDTETAALGHKWGDWVVTKEPTTSAEGEETRTCQRSGCGKTETRAVEKLPAETEPPHEHDYEAVVTAPTCESKGYTTYTCACGHSYTDDETDALGHSWGEWIRTKEPTTSAEGEDTRECSGCGKTETRVVEKLPEDNESGEDVFCDSHSWGNWTSDSNGSYGSCTNCGQSITIDGSTSSYAQDVITIINEYRAAEGLDPVEWFSANIIRIRAHELTVYYSHSRPDGSYGEGDCIAGGYSSARAVVDAWMGSSGHRGNIMNANATRACAAYNGSFWVLYIG